MTPTGNPALFNTALFNEALFGGQAQNGALVKQVGTGILYPALRKAGVTIGPQRTPSPAQFQDAIEELNRLVGSLNCDRLFIYSRTTYTFPLTGAKTYTIGQDPQGVVIADFDVPRPQVIEEANVIIFGSTPTRRPLFLATDQQWSKIITQDIANAIPEMLYNDRAYPISTLYLWGQPVAGFELELFVWNLASSFQSLSDVVSMPPGYDDALTLNLACRLAPHFQRVIPPDVVAQARESLMRLESINAPRPIADTSAVRGSLCGGRYNIYGDYWR